MDLYRSIFQRKSCRKYNMEPLEQGFFNEIDEALESFNLLYPETSLQHRFTRSVKGLFRVEAPHYLIVSGCGKPDEMESTGFWLEQLVLWLDVREIGSVWLGSSKDTEVKKNDQDIIALAFGRSTESIHRTQDQFKREPIETITNAPEDERIQAAHLAPSGLNTQPWYFQREGDTTLVYKKKLKAPLSLTYKLSDIDMGIGLCHYALACKNNNQPFQFSRDASLPGKSGYTPFGIIK